MSASDGSCIKCSAVNVYKSVVCVQCGARLPWAGTVTKIGLIAANIKPDAMPAAQSNSGSFFSTIAFRVVVYAVLVCSALVGFAALQSMVDQQMKEATTPVPVKAKVIKKYQNP